jgi:hypothetical protein
VRIRNLDLCLSILLAASGSVSTAEPPKAEVKDHLSSRLFPMRVGDCWNYAFEDKEVVFTVLGSDKVGESTLFVVRRAIGKEVVEFKVSVEEDGVYIHADGKKEFSPPLRQFAFFAKSGDSWKWRGTESGKDRSYEFENLGRQAVKVPAGEYQAIAVQQSDSQAGESSTFWLAEGVGIVRLSGKRELSKAGQLEIFEWKLKSFKRGE